MEAIRPQTECPAIQHHIEDGQPEQHDNEILELPPPPAPFPIDFLMYSSEATVEESARIHPNLADIQRSCVDALTTLLPKNVLNDDGLQTVDISDKDKQLVQVLSELLEASYELDTLHSSVNRSKKASTAEGITGGAKAFSSDQVENHKAVDIQSSYTALINHLTRLQAVVQSRQANTVSGMAAANDSVGSSPNPNELQPAINVVREEMVWARIETLSNAVIELVRGRLCSSREVSSSPSADLFASQDDHQVDEPPVYTRTERLDSHMSDAMPPSYQNHDIVPGPLDDEKEDKGKTKHTGEGTEEEEEPATSVVAMKGASRSASEEKMMRDLEAVTQAIERLHCIAPQLHDQRSRPPVASSSNVASSSLSSREEQMRQRKMMRELDSIWNNIERAHGKRRNRQTDDQRAEWSRSEVLHDLYERAEEGRRQAKDLNHTDRRSVDADLARARELKDRDQFLRELLEQSSDGRMNDQDAQPNESNISLSERRQAFLNNLVSKTRVGRMSSQDFPQSIETRLAERKEKFIDTIVDYSSSGRLHDQDSSPPTPFKPKDEDPHELVTAHDFLSTATKANSATNVGSIGGCDSRRGSTSIGMERGSSGDSTLSISLAAKGRSRSNSSGAFKRIAGMVRRGSMGLSLKGGGVFDASSISYIAEHQENLHVIQVMIQGLDVATNSDLALQTDKEKIALISKTDSSINIPIALPGAVHPSQTLPLIPCESFTEAKLSAIPVPSKPPTLNSAITHALSAPELRVLQPKALCCTSCDREVADLSIPSRMPEEGYKDLPSEFWAEMMEVWMCHTDPSFTAQLAKRTKDGFWPKKNTVLAGGTYLLVDGSQVKDSHMIIHESAKSDQWRVVQCSCGEVLGKQRTRDEKPGAGAVRFSKWAIALLCDDDMGERVEPVRFPVSTFLVSDMLELSQAHASYRFIISDEETGERRLAIWLFNPSIGISYLRPPIVSPIPSPLRASFTDKSSSNLIGMSGSHSASPLTAMANGAGSGGMGSGRMSRRSSNASFASGNNQSTSRKPTAKTLRAAKIMYKALDPFLGDVDETLQLLPGFGAGCQVEQLLYSRDACVRLISALRESNTLYPLSRRTMGPFEIGFLERF